MMTAKELAEKHNTPLITVQVKAKKALERNEALVLEGTAYRVLLKKSKEARGKVYVFEEMKPQTVTLKLDELDKKWMRAPEEKKREALLKAELVGLWERRRAGTDFEGFVKSLPERYEDINVSKASFFRWVKKVRDAREAGIAPSYALLDNRGGLRGSKKITPKMAQMLEKWILQAPHTQTVRLQEWLGNHFDEVPSYATVERWVKKWKESNALVYAFAKNPDAAISKYRPAFGKMDANVKWRNQLWELDATPADIITADGKRLILSAAIDVYSRLPVVVLEESASFTTLGRLFRKAIKQMGIPDAVKTDNGRDYTSNNFALMCQRLGIDHILVPPYSGYYKPHIERFFRTLAHGLFENLPGYIGHNVAQRQEIINRQSFEQRLKTIEAWRKAQKSGSAFAKRFALKKENRGMAVEVPLTREELQALIDDWIAMYTKRVHKGINARPIERWEQSGTPVRTISDARVLDVMVGMSEVRPVTKKGIRISNIHYTAPELFEFVGERVVVLMDDDLGKVYVYDNQYNYICTALSEEHLGQSRALYLKAAKSFDKKVRKLAKLLEELRAEPHGEMERYLARHAGREAVADVGYEHKNEATAGIVTALEANNEQVHDELKSESVVPTIAGRPVFKTPYDRFVYELKNNCVSEKTLQLAEKYKESWEAAKRAAS